MNDVQGDNTVRVGKELYGYDDSKRNYVAPMEITVTITLQEYRDLVEKNAKSDKIASDIKEKYEARISKLQEDLDFHKAQLERLKKELNPKHDSEADKD